jgi:hypothetical protein
MTHTLHRHGSVESLKEDYVVLIARAQGIYAPCRVCFQRKFPRFYALIRKMALKLGIVKLLDIGGGFGVTVLNNRKELAGYLKKLKEKKMKTGVSVVVSGLFDEVNDCLKELDLSPHTVMFSLGHLGKIEVLPKEEVLEITTMCGHHMVSPKLVEKLASDIKKGKITRREAVRVMANQCVCAAFNQTRAVKLMEVLTN